LSHPHDRTINVREFAAASFLHARGHEILHIHFDQLGRRAIHFPSTDAVRADLYEYHEAALHLTALTERYRMAATA
jgi:hypothetical protein